MKTFVAALKACESASGAGKKTIIRDALSKLSKDGRKLMFYAMSPYFTYGVKKYTRPSEYADEDAGVETIIHVLDQLRTRELTGTAARNIVTMLLGAFTKETSSYIERIIDKDLKAGFSPETYNKVWPKDKVPTFEVMLADRCADEDEFEQYVTFPCQGDIKYDGTRTISITEKAGSGIKVTNISRSGLEAFYLNGLFDREFAEIEAYVADKFGWTEGFVLDSESFANDWTDTMNAKKSGLEGEDAKSRLVLRAFFIMPLQDWHSQKCDITMRQNRENIRQMLEDLPSLSRIVLTKGREVVDYQDMTGFCDEVTTPGYDGQPKGHEGLILKDWDATYSWDRSMAWCKVKKFYDVSMKIIGFLPGRPKTKFEHTLGKLMVIGRIQEGPDKGTFVKCNVGSGIKTLKPKDDTTTPTRDEIWNNKAAFLGTTVDLKYQEISLAKGKSIHSLRFGTVFRFRDDITLDIEDVVDGQDDIE